MYCLPISRVAAFVTLTSCSAFAQLPPTPALEFEVASVKPNTSGGNGPYTYSPSNGKLTATNIPLAYLLQAAFNLQEYQIKGLPSWAAERYDVVAKASNNNVTRAEARLMLQALLKERFRLMAHVKTEDMPRFALRVAKGGSKLKASEGAECSNPPLTQSPSSTPPCGRVTWGPNEISGRRASVQQFIYALSQILSRNVVDETGLKGPFDVTLHWTPDSVNTDQTADSAGPSLFNELQSKLGLKLESQRGPVEILMIDHLEKPTAN